MKQLRIGSRESRLAVIQSEQVADYLRSQGVDAPLVTMKTTGDIILDRTLDKIGGKGLFVKELDKALKSHYPQDLDMVRMYLQNAIDRLDAIEEECKGHKEGENHGTGKQPEVTD